MTNAAVYAAGDAVASAREQGLRFRANDHGTASWYSSQRVGPRHSGFMLAEEEAERIRGASSSDVPYML